MSTASVLVVNKSLLSSGDDVGKLINAAFVLGLTAGRELSAETFGGDVIDGDGTVHRYLTKIGHYVRKASGGKLRSLRQACEMHNEITVVDYTDAASPASYAEYEKSLSSQQGENITYRAIHISGPAELVSSLTKSLSRA